MNNLTKQDIVHGLRSGGLHHGSHVLLHSSLSSMGKVEGGADTVLDAILEVIGATGTLIAPTLTGDETLCAAKPPIFDVKESKCWTGKIPETLRLRPDSTRSHHPTHSVSAIGGKAKELTQWHLHSVTPCDEWSPYGLLAQEDEGFIVLLGVDHESNTTMHHVEELAGCDYHMQPTPVRAVVRFEGEQKVVTSFLHIYGQERHFDAVEPLLLERGIQRNVTIGNATVRIIRSKPFVQVTLAALRANPRFLCLDE